MKRTFQTKKTAQTLLTAALLIGVSGFAHAMQDSDSHKDGFIVESTFHPDHDDDQAKSTTRSVRTYKINDDDHSYELRMEDGLYIVKVDGKLMPDKQVKKKGDIIIVTDKDGDLIYEFKTGNSFSGSVAAPRSPALPMRVQTIRANTDDSDGFTFDINVEAKPKVMLGIYSDGVGDSLREHLGIKGDAIMVESVIKGLSADKAGIKDNDIIISIDGSDGMSPTGLTDFLKKRDPGDKIKIVVLRKGEKKTLNAELFAYDAVALGHDNSASNIWVTEDSKFPAVVGGTTTGRLSHQTDSFFTPQAREQTQERIIAKLREKGVDESIIVTIEEDLASTLDGNFWAPKAQGNNNQRIFRFTDDQDQHDASSDAHNQQRQLVDSMQRKAEQAMREAQRMTLEFKDGQLLFKRHAEGLENHIHELEERLHEQMPHIEEELGGRLEELEERLEELEDALDERMESLSGLIERLIDRLDED